MLRIILLFSLTLFTSRLEAQNSPKRFYVDATIGTAIPTGTFAEKQYMPNIAAEPNGLATVGFSANLLPGYIVNDRVRLFIVLGVNVNKQSASSFHDYLASVWPEAAKIEVETKSWVVYKVMPGISYMFRPSNSVKLSFRPHAAVGISKTAVPEFQCSMWKDGEIHPFATQNGSKRSLPIGFAFDAGCGADYKIGKGLRLLIDVSCFNSNTKITDRINFSIPDPGPYVDFTRKYILNTINIMAGVQWTL